MEAKAIQARLSRPLALYLTQAFDICSSLSADVVLHRIESIWWWVRAAVVVPVVKAAVLSCLVMSVMLVAEKLSMALVSLYVAVFRRTPEKVYRWEPLSWDMELGSSAYPMVLVQIPMFNEREVPNYLTPINHLPFTIPLSL
uniref:Glucomannan 4-beta-mannosyltransferase 7 n=1 Tax=Elaeis guineensis var. tenera TaxID=51953 RepID=A0A6I9QL88_ELAGV|nr:glucomannan 4-beta-mannosyltransferase 7 [Elaeis guineensis]